MSAVCPRNGVGTPLGRSSIGTAALNLACCRGFHSITTPWFIAHWLLVHSLLVVACLLPERQMKQILDSKERNSETASPTTAGVTNFVMRNPTLARSLRLAVTTQSDQMLRSGLVSKLGQWRAA